MTKEMIEIIGIAPPQPEEERPPRQYGKEVRKFANRHNVPINSADRIINGPVRSVPKANQPGGVKSELRIE